MPSSIEKLVFDAAAALDDATERQTFLNQACGSNPTLRKWVDSLLEVQAEADAFFEFQPEIRSTSSASDNDEEGLDVRIDQYRLIARIGAGGGGVVYLAEQERPVRRKVALKVIKLGMDTEAVIARFELERQSLAQMDHPNIARVFDAGTTGSGRPYFVMELVEGERITDFCDAHRLNIRQRLELFVLVCRAIQHAHHKGVINRDIKPSNVLVRMHEGVPAPKVIDFGIAKAVTNGMENKDSTFTPFNQFVGTPAYMSPEQAQGSNDVDTRSDIYSLGVLLYELLSGQTPFDLQRLTENTMDEVRRIIRDEEPRPPSTALRMAGREESTVVVANRHADDLRQLVAELADDLDWIVMKAMEKERSRRYESAVDLAMDVQRHLSDEPVLARPPSRAYLLGKLVRRNKLVFTAASIATFGLLAGFGTSTWMFFQEKAARQEQARLLRRAELREEVTRAAVKISYGDLAGADQLLGKVPIEQTPPSLEAANAFRAVAEWHVQAGEMTAAAAAFSSMARAISSVDKSDLPTVSFNLLPAAATVAYADGAPPYEAIRQMAIARFSSTGNLGVAEQTLKACLLLPAGPKTLQALTPLSGMLERAFVPDVGVIENNPHYTGWVLFSLSLMHYRMGEYPEAARWVGLCLNYPTTNEARTATTLIVRAMIEQRSGQTETARATLAQARDTVHGKLMGQEWKNTPWPAYWFDWINAAVLLSEAEHLIGSA